MSEGERRAGGAGRAPGSGPEPRPDGERAPEGGAEGWVRQEAPSFRDATGGRRRVPAAEVLAREHARPEAGAEDLEADVERLHRPIFREPRDPIEGREPAPWWLWAAAAVALFWGGWYLGRHGGTFRPVSHIAYGERVRPVAEAAAEGRALTATDPVAAGRVFYRQHCQSCHQQSGLGLPGAFPPLVGSEWVTGAPATVVRILLGGLQGPLEVAGRTYNGVMPAWRDVLTDAEIAAVATYIRQWGPNDASPVAPELVARLRVEAAGRARPWTAAELIAAEEGPP